MLALRALRPAVARAAALSSSRTSASSTAVRPASQTKLRCLNTTGQYVPSSPSGFAAATAPGALNLPVIKNEPMYPYAAGDTHRVKLEAALKKLLASNPLSIPAVIGDKEIHATASTKQVVTSPTNHRHVLAEFAETTADMADEAIANSLQAKAAWENLPFTAKAAIFLRAADLLAGPYRYDMLASVMVGQGKNVWQAEIDAAAEAIDFWRFNVQYAAQLFNLQPTEHSPTVWNRVEYRPLEGFVFAVTPFNFAAIGANLASAPALMGNTVLWKPSNTALHSNYLMYKILREAGLPAGVINFLPGNGLAVGERVFKHKDFTALHFTGSTKTFQSMWQTIGQNITGYRSYPRIVGETGGKNFHFVHASADAEAVVHQSIRSAFEYSGQKCSALSRMYVPESLWPRIKAGLISHTRDIISSQFGPVEEFKNFVTAVIDERSFDRIDKVLKGVKADAKAGKGVEILVGGEVDKSRGWFVQPTIIEVKDPKYTTMQEEIFGPVLTVYVYPDAQYSETLDLCDSTSPYALTGSLFCRDRYALEYGSAKLRHSSGNFYINDKSTGAVVGQQPFGGARGSGTNDKAGAMQNLLRWTSARAIKESFVPISTYKYPSNL
jgi:1-pyrroline-5-carboxylate dehydrogenase